MTNTLEQLLSYAAEGQGRITTVTPYLKDLRGCLSSDTCPAKSLGISGSDWDAMEKAAGERLAYCDPKGFVDVASVKSASPEGWGELDDEIPKKTIAVYDAVLATKDKDRDGDIVHPEGMQLVAKMPLLWQHVWSSPIGVMIKTIEQNEDRNVNRYAIGDTALGKDAATLVSMGALRKSHGFLPIPGQIEPISMVKGADGQDRPSGYNIKGLSVFESSLVSVPAGAKAEVLHVWAKEFDAICDAVSEKKLQTPIIKSWASSLYESRTKVFGGVSVESSGSQSGRVQVDINVHQVPTTKELSEPMIESVTELAPALTKAMGRKYLGNAMPDYMPGSFEDIQQQVAKAARVKVEAMRDGDDNCYVQVIATYADSAIVCCHEYRSSKRTCYDVDWTLSEDGKVKLAETMTEVTIEPTVITKSFTGVVLPESQPPQTKSLSQASDPVMEMIDSL